MIDYFDHAGRILFYAQEKLKRGSVECWCVVSWAAEASRMAMGIL